MQIQHHYVHYLNSTIISVCDYFIHIVRVHHQQYTHTNVSTLHFVYMACTISHWGSLNSQYFAITTVKLLSGMIPVLMHPHLAVL